MAADDVDLHQRFHDLSLTVADLRQTNTELIASRDTLLSHLECPVCLDICEAPIFMCKNGHNLCSSCKQQVDICPTCRVQGRPVIRNLFAEAFREEFGGVCKHKEYGCKSFVLKSKLAEHQLDCEFRYECLSCELFHGDLDGLDDHLSEEHGLVIHDTEWEGNVSAQKLQTFVHLYCHDGIFRCGLNVKQRGLCIFVRYFGPRRNAVKYKCWFRFTSEDGEFKCCYLVRSRDTSVQFDEDDYVVVNSDNVNRLKRGIGTVWCDIKIKEVE